MTKASDIHAASPARAPQESIRTRTVVVYLALALLVLIPGALLRMGYDGFVPALKPAFDSLQANLLDIRFGGGLRFWFGVAGFTMMAVLIFYPLRKWFGTRRIVGRVGGWFQFHIVLGIAGPVAIAYHTNFGHGAMHANLALWAMIVVAVSGLIGHFVYARASADFYRGKLRAREQVNAIIGLLNGLDAMHPSRATLIAEFEAFEKDLLTPRQGILGSLLARLRMEGRRRKLSRALGWHLGECAVQLRLNEATHGDLRKTTARHLAAFISLARHGASRSVSEQLLARWRLLHLPVFLIMLVATGLHVRNVWDMDAIIMTRAPAPAVRPPLPIAPVPTEIKRAVPAASTAQPSARAVASATDGAKVEPKASVPKAAAPQATIAPPPAAPEAPRPVAKPAPPPAVVTPAPSPPPQHVEAPRPVPPRSAAAKDPVDDLAEQARMSLGANKPRTLTDQIAAYKARKQAGAFAHSQAETGFGLIGKHVKVDCIDCHKAPLREGPQTKVRACIDCHKQDDVHRGRRPNCAQCHTPNSWGEIIRRR